MTKNRKHVISAGHICLDITPVFKTDSDCSDISQILIPGSLAHVGDADIHTGGSVSNTGLALKMLGADVSLMGKVGDDAFGSMVINLLDSYGAGGIIVSPGSSTSYSIVLAVPGIDRIFLHNPGANDSFSSDDIPDEALLGADLFHFGYPPLMKKMYADNGRELINLFRRVKSLGILTSLDMAAVSPGSEASEVNWRSILSLLLPYVDFFVPSYEEIAFMLGYSDYNIDALDMNRDVRPLAHELKKMGSKVVLIKCGISGLYYLSDNEEGVQPAFEAEKICSATGAGDTCIAAFLLSMLDGNSVADSARIAAAEGACCVTAYDALSGLLPIEALEAKINSGWKTI